MELCYKFDLKEIKKFSASDLEELFHSVMWDIDTPSDILIEAMENATKVISAWDGDKLVGIIRSMDDGCWSANIDCLVVHSDYQRKGIGTILLQTLLKQLDNVVNISVCPDDNTNNSFYQKFGFKIIEDSNLLQITRDF